MTALAPEVTTVYISAVGGQGGALLTEWLLAAARQMHYRAHAVGIPGMSQRGGATSYYVEIVPEQADHELHDAILSPAPFPGEIGCLIGLEMLELGRAVEAGYSSDQTTVIGSTHRDYTVLEKMPSYVERQDEDTIVTLLERLAGRVVTFDARVLARAEGLAERHVNAILIGAVAATKALPMREEAYRLAIKVVGVAPDLNLRAFEAGLRHVLAGLPPLPKSDALAAREHISAISPKQQEAHSRLMEKLPPQINEELGFILEVACARLIEYHDEAYAQSYLDRVLAPWIEEKSVDRGGRLAQIYARHTANLMTYEDPVRVAALKSDPRRFERIQSHHGIQAGQPYRLREHFRPEMEELYGLLPVKLVHWFRPPTEGASGEEPNASRRSLSVSLKTTSLLGMVVLKCMSALRWLRPYSWRRWKEEQLLEAYTDHIKAFLEKSYDLACVVAQAGGMIRGYGGTRRRTERIFHTYIQKLLHPLVELDERCSSNGDYALTLRAVAKVQSIIKPTGAGFEEAVALPRALQAHEQGCSYDELLEMVMDFEADPVLADSSPCAD
jgi:indolepyruvate ferredoxin oxidoreductase beta subunit